MLVEKVEPDALLQLLGFARIGHFDYSFLTMKTLLLIDFTKESRCPMLKFNRRNKYEMSYLQRVQLGDFRTARN